MSWLSVSICSDLKTLVRANGGVGKEARSRECSLFCLQFKDQDLPHRAMEKNLILVPRCEQQWSERGS